MEYNRIMQSEFSSSWGYLDKQQSRGDAKRPLSTYYDLSGGNEKPVGGKALRWNIEESKENLKDDHRVHFTASLSALETTTNSPYPSRLPSAKRAWEPLQTQTKRPVTSKSYKTITFSNELEREYEKQRGTNDDYMKSKENSKWLTMSMGHKSTIADLITPIYTPKMERKEEPEMRRMKSSKSQKRIHYQIDEPITPTPTLKSQFSKNHYVLECSEKSSKKILDKKEEEKEKGNTHLNQNPIPSFVNRSCKIIKDEPIPIRPKMEKTTSYHGTYQPEPLQKLHPRKHQTVQPSRSYHHITDTQVPPSPTPSTPPRHHKLSIHDFQIGKCKGEGAFGQVFPAIHKATRMLVALKKVPKEKVKYMLQQFINEIKIQLFLNHPNIVSLYGFFDDATHFYIVMEYMDGGNLFGLIKKKKKLTQPQAVQKLKEVCLGLKEMHDNSILHRDIKPENIVMTNDVSKLCDFGWAAICKDRRTTYCGTLDYVSPQIISGQGYDDSVDVWCIGVLAFELICGRPPFYNISRKETMKRICDVHYEYPCEVSPMGKAFIDRILKKNPEERIGIDEVLKHPFLNSSN